MHIMNHNKKTATRLKSLLVKGDRGDQETTENCNTEFDFVNFDAPTMTKSLHLDLKEKTEFENPQSAVSDDESLCGSLWQISDGFLSRWREQFCVLTKNSIYCFNSSRTGATRKVSKIQLSDICDVKMVRQKGQLMLCLEVDKQKRLMFRAEEGIRVWYENILDNIAALRSQNFRRCFSVEYQQKRATMSFSSITYEI